MRELERPMLSPDLLARFGAFLAEQMGLHFPPERRPELERALAEAAPVFGCRDVESCLHWLLSASLTRAQVETLAGYLTIGETYFFRERSVMAALENQVLPTLIGRRRREKRLRIWSAACASGEEPYSIAMLLDRCLPEPAEWDVTLLATDINPAALQKAAAGVYREWSFRDKPPEVKARYFKKNDQGHYELDARLKRRVTFGYLNLAEDSYPSLLGNTNAMDLILCRNVLLYFAPERVRRVVEKLRRSLAPGGWLVAGQTEISLLNGSGLEARPFPGAILHRNDGAAGWLVPDVAAPAVEPPPRPAAPSASPVAPVIEAALDPAIEAAVASAAHRAGEPVNEVTDPAAMARALADLGRLEAAQACCQRAIASDKLNPSHYYLLAAIAQERGALAEAAMALRSALFLEPDFVLAYYALGRLAERRGQTAAAARHYENARRLLARHPPEAPLPHGDGLTAGRLAQIIGLRLGEAAA